MFDVVCDYLFTRVFLYFLDVVLRQSSPLIPHAFVLFVIIILRINVISTMLYCLIAHGLFIIDEYEHPMETILINDRANE